MNEWDEQIRKLKQKQEQSKQTEVTYNKTGRCSCGCGRFGHEMRNGDLIRICHDCKAEKEF